MEKISDMNVLYDAFRAALKSSAWKEEPQRVETDFLSELAKLKEELEDRTYTTQPRNVFITHERGKERLIHGGRMRDRIVRHALCDHILNPTLRPYIMHNNSASQEGKGIDFARRSFEQNLHNYWLEHRTNEGWVCFVDFSKFYDNIRHDYVKEAICPKLEEYPAWLFSNIIDTFRVDVSYLTNKEYERCIDRKFNSIEYFKSVPMEKQTGERFLEKSVDIGDQISQSIGVYYPTPIDNYITIVRGFRRAGRYMDDIYMIHQTKAYIMETLDGIYDQTKKLGLFINEKKTRICRLSDTYTYLQMKYSLTDTGRVIRRIHPKSVTRERRKLKAYRNLLEKGQIAYPQIEQAYKSWMGRYAHFMSKDQIKHMKQLYFDLFKEDPRWKKKGTQ